MGLAGLLLFPLAARGQGDVADIPSVLQKADGDADKQYFLIGPKPGAAEPKEGYRLLMVLPGGDGSADFNAFVRRILKNGLPDSYLVAELVAPAWSNDGNRVVWPTRKLPAEGMKFPTEEFIHAVYQDVRARKKIDLRYVFTLGWSSGGTPCYTAALEPNRVVTGSYVAMSVFKPDLLPPLSNGKGTPFFILHSPQDAIPIRMARQARDLLAEQGAKTNLVTYKGGHGWRGDVYGNIRQGVEWLEANAAKPIDQPPAPAVQATAPSGPKLALANPGFEEGTDSPAGWQMGAQLDGVTYTWDRSAAHTGHASLRLDKSVNHYFPIAQWFQQVPNSSTARRLKVSAWVKARQAYKATVDVQFSADGEQWTHQWAAYIGARDPGDPPADHDWKRYEGMVNIPEGTKQILIGLQIYGPGTVWFDDIDASYVD